VNRRQLLKLFGWGAAALAADPEKLVWVPGQKLISLPSSSTEIYEVMEEFYFSPAIKAIISRIDDQFLKSYLGLNTWQINHHS
jgi:hypothetical protein